MNEVENVYGLGTDIRYENTMCRVCRHSVGYLQDVDGPPILLWTGDDIQGPIQNGVRALDILGRRKFADKTQAFRGSFPVVVGRGSLRSWRSGNLGSSTSVYEEANDQHTDATTNAS